MKNLRFLVTVLAFAFALAGVAAAPILAQVHGTMAVNDARLRGTHPSGEMMLYSPNPVQIGSSISHWDTAAFPNLLMEPFINPDLAFLDLDATPGLMQDIGWSLGNSGITIYSFDAPGTGFDDPRPFAGAPGNPAATLGEARANLVNAVLGAWGSTLFSPVPIDVIVLWLPLPCGPFGAALASAGPTFIFRDDSGQLPMNDTWYHAALTEALVGADITGPPHIENGRFVGGDIIVFINSEIDNECLAPGTGYYFGLDGNNPPNLIDLAPTVLHEIGHGLGFSNFTDEATGSLLGGFPGIYDVFTYDHLQGKTWVQMTDEERARSARSFRQVTWNGANANAMGQALLGPGVPELTITSPASIAGTYEVGAAAFGPPLDTTGLSGRIACMRDAFDLASGDLSGLNGCSPATNPGALAGKIALIDRGACLFTDKVMNAQDAGAIGAIIVNASGGVPPGLGGDPSLPITIPAVSVSNVDGNRIRQAACPETAGSVGGDRFQVMAYWTTPEGTSGMAHAQPLTGTTSWFYFYDPDNVELVVKVLDGCAINDRFWVFAAGLTNVEVVWIVTDTLTGDLVGYVHQQGVPFMPVQDTEAFATCP